MTIDFDAYLDRIGYAGPRRSTAAVLRDLQRAHLLAVPFENLDINPIGTPIVLSPDALFHKVVVRRRGGFCYELNGLFAIALEQLGFDVTRVAGQVSRGDGKFGPEFDHLALVVRVDGATHLADVGFGDFSLEPLDLSVRGPQEPRGAAARRMASTRPTTRRGSRGSRRGTTAGPTATASDCSRGGSRISRRSAAGSRPISTRTSARKRVCSIATAGGRVTLTDTELIVTSNGERLVTPVSEDGWRNVLADHSGSRRTWGWGTSTVRSDL
jgi:N-hydroxyarylamine O-acetyltransferase